jgi:translation initiation factor IF-2
MDNLRVSELAKELNMTSKDLIEKFAEISISVKSHSNTLTPDQIRKIKEHLGVAPKKNTAKKAFIVKKAKPTEEPEVIKTTPKEPAKIEKVQRNEKPVQKVEVVEKEEKPILLKG